MKHVFRSFIFVALISTAWIVESAVAALSPAQLQILKDDILANPDLNSQPNTSDGAFEIARLYNLNAAPNFTVWKTSVPIQQVGQSMDAGEVAGLTTANTNRLLVYANFSGGSLNPSNDSIRAGFDSIFSGAGGVNTRANLLALWKRRAKRGEKLFAVGTGSDAAPATLTFEGNITLQDVLTARSLP